jgi:gluconate 5-dehydrogenase
MTSAAHPLPSVELFNLTGKTALVTGSSSGIGLELARGLLGAGASVIINGRSAEKLQSAHDFLTRFVADHPSLVSAQVKVHICAFDVTDPQDVSQAVDKAHATWGPIDILINNAGMTFRSELQDFPLEQWNKILRTNVDSAFFVSKAVVKHMIASGQGKIINTCSVMSELGRPGTGAYTASKGALKMLTKAMAIDWGKYGVQANGIGPGYFKTELTEALVKDETFSNWLISRTPSKRWGNVEDLIGAAVFLSSNASNFVNGHILYVDGGVTASL